MSTINLASPECRKFIVRPLHGQNQIYDNIPTEATVRDLKERIFVAEGISIENQKLIYGPEIMDDSRTLESYHIREGFVIRLLAVVQPPPTPIPAPSAPNVGPLDINDRVLQTVFVKSANGPSVTMSQVRLRTTVEDFIAQYSRRRGQDPDFCRLIFGGKELESMKAGNVMTLMDYNVQDESTLHEVFRVPGGYDECGPGVNR